MPGYSGTPPDLGEVTVRALALPLGFVGVEESAVSAVWPASKHVVRRELRRR